MPKHATLGVDGKLEAGERPDGGPGGAAWGGITGTLSDQSDLKGALDAKVASSDARLSDARTPLTHSHAAADVTGTAVLTNDARLSDARAPTAHSHAWGSVTGTLSNQTDLQNALNGKQAAGTYATGTGTASGTNTGDQTLPIKATGAEINTGTDDAKFVTAKALHDSAAQATYRTILDSSGSHIAGKVAGTYGLAQSQPLAVTGTGTLYPLNTIYIAAADYATVNGLAPKLRVRFNIYCNDTAPFTGTFVCGLHPVTRPATSGGTGVLIYTIGAAVAGSTVTGTNLAADSSNPLVGSDFALPADGHYILALVTNGTMATNSLAHVSASVQLRNA